MPFYKYKYLKDGKELDGVKEFADKSALYLSVRADGGSIISVKEIGKKKNKPNFFKTNYALSISKTRKWM